MTHRTIERGIMTENLDLLNTAVSLLFRAVLLAARFSGRVRRRSLKRLAAMDTDAKAKERRGSWPTVSRPPRSSGWLALAPRAEPAHISHDEC